MHKGFVFFSIFALLYSPSLLAKEKSKVFVQFEANDTDRINTVGVSNFMAFPNSDFGSEALTSFSYAEIMTNTGIVEQYLAWEAGFRMGYYGAVSAYIEAGVDLTELILEQDRNDCCVISDGTEEDSIDGYIGVGAGVQMEAISIEAFVRLRQIDGRYWQSESHAFGGMAVALRF